MNWSEYEMEDLADLEFLTLFAQLRPPPITITTPRPVKIRDFDETFQRLIGRLTRT